MKKRRGYISVETIIIVAIVLFVGVCFLLGLIGRTNDSKETQDKVFDDAMLVVDGNTVGPDGGIIVPDKPEPDKNKVFHGGSLADISKIRNLTNLKIVHIQDLNSVKPKDGVKTIDVSANRDGSVLSWTDDSGISYIAGRGGVKFSGIINSGTNGLFKSSQGMLEEFYTNNFLDMSEVTSIENMFNNNQVLRVCDLSGVDTSNVTDMRYMFFACYKLETLNIKSFNTVNVTDMSSMFYYCRVLKQIDVSHFNTKKVIYMSSMFGNCNSLTVLDLSNFNTSNVTTMSDMFSYCDSIGNLDLSNFDTSSVINMSKMFNHCRNLFTLDISSFDTSNVRSMYSMFYCCSRLEELDLSNFDVRNVTDMDEMFSSGPYPGMSLKKIYVSSLWQINKDTNTKKMFRGCEELADQKGLDYNKSWDEKMWMSMANYETGYLTLKE